jgi:hypothetical protein
MTPPAKARNALYLMHNHRILLRHRWTRNATPQIPILPSIYNDIGSLGGGVKVARDFTCLGIADLRDGRLPSLSRQPSTRHGKPSALSLSGRCGVSPQKGVCRRPRRRPGGRLSRPNNSIALSRSMPSNQRSVDFQLAATGSSGPPRDGMNINGNLLDKCLKDCVSTVLVEFDTDFGPKIVWQVV